ncbi:hypothetical protein [Bradyrhizobium sp. 930_D9_N1_4]|uniref:hypothetical protein n=1 Tax=Bradyrhizobium sp. 930_D9_N1_4 TaxID=3240374 RepID=UPI003F8C52F4
MHRTPPARPLKACSRRIRILAAVVGALMPALFCSNIAFAIDRECIAPYYRSKSLACVEQTLAELQETNKQDPNTIIGFLAQIFRDQPSRARLLKSEASNYTKSIMLVGLYRAGLTTEAQTFAASNNLSDLVNRLHATPIVPLEQIKPFATPADNDILTGAYLASGDTALIRRILDNYASADDAMASDGMRIGLMIGKFGPDLTPEGRTAVTMQAGCERYQCKSDPAKLLRVLTLATAMWSLSSLSVQDEGIRKTVSDFFERTPRLKSRLIAERTAFGNYLVALAGLAAFSGKESNADAQRVFQVMSDSAAIYERLGPANEAFDAMNALKK